MKKLTSILLVVLSLMMIGSSLIVGAGASSAYQTYTYSINGEALYSPDAYNASSSLDYKAMGMDVNFNTPKDLLTDHEGRIYIADSKNNRIVILNSNYRFYKEISTFKSDERGGNLDALSGPQGVFVTEDEIWVCDTGKFRLVVFDREGNYKRIIDAPNSQLISSKEYVPVAMAIDQYGRIYVISSACSQGVIVMDSTGGFVGFIGAQKVTLSAWEIIWKRFQTDEQKKLEDSVVATGFNNICISSDGFIYVTSSSLSEGTVESAIKAQEKDGKNMPVKLLNPAGDEIMRRNGFWPPAGEVDFSSTSRDAKKGIPVGASTIIDVATGPEKTWTIADSKRQKLYTYDYNGNLLFAFGDEGMFLGNISDIVAVTYQGDNLLVLDNASGVRLTVYERTEYGDLLLQAIAAENALDNEYAIQCWESVLQRNSNFDAAYIGIGNSLYRSGEYEQALSYYEKAYDTESWSQSYKEVRKEWMSDWFIPMVLGVIVAIVLLIKFLGWAAKVNKRVSTDGKERKTFGQELLYGFYVIFHPFDGFYDLKHENRGAVRAALVFLGLTVVTFFYQSVGRGYVLNPTGETGSLFTQVLLVILLVMLFVVGNWCLTTLFEGEGSMKNIFIAVCYSLLPMILLIIPSTLASNWISADEAGIISMLTTVSFVWVGLLLFFGTMVTHDYSLGKNFICILGTLVAMIFIVFIVLLFGMLLSKLISLVTNIITEIQYRA
ncbi:MAG: YIP1 family protein [Clostridia bacterium]|nr:YIP1 family protein [Clostridia bacterium]